MRTVVFVAPFPLAATMRFCRALAALEDVRLVGLFQQPPADASGFAHVERVGDALDPAQLLAGCQRVIARFGPLHRVLGVLENLQEQVAWVRGQLGLPGTDAATARLFRDKAAMKDALRAAGLPCARHRLCTSAADARAFVAEVGLPIVVKPPAGAGCKATYRVRTPADLDRCLAEARVSPDRPTLAEEFLVGEEHSFDTLTVGGQVRMASITRYLPTPLEVMESPWVQWVVLAPRVVEGPDWEDIHDLGQRVVTALGLQTSITHMEWFRRADGSLAIGEIAARPPGARIMDLIGWVHDRDAWQAWARLMVDEVVDGSWERRYAAAAVFLRQPGGPRVTGLTGVEEAQAAMGALVVDAQLPRPGQHRSDGYEGEGQVILRHPDTGVVLDGVAHLFRTLRVQYR